MEHAILRMEGIQKEFFGVPVLKKVDFTLHEGKVHALVGGNGAGKSTLMKILTGVYKKDGGAIYFEEKPVMIGDYAAASRLGIRMIYQELSDIPTMKVWENIFLNHETRRGIFLDKSGMRKAAAELLARFHMEIDADETMENLGVGYCQMIEIAKALSMNAKVLIMDEPTASLSAGEVEVLFSLINRLKEQKVSIVYISHRMGEILRIADEVTVLKDGQVAFCGSTEGLSIDGIVSYMLGTEKKDQMSWHENLYTGPKEELLRVENLAVDGRIRDISFSAHRGEIVGIAGLLGSGRTEILETVFGIRKPVEGDLYIRGEKVRLRSAGDGIRHGVALVPEDRRRKGLVLIHSVFQNVILPSMDRLRKRVFVDARRAKEMVDGSVREFRIKTHDVSTLAQRLSGGNQQKIVVAKWLKTGPEILLLDEPTAGIDIGAKGEILDIVRAYSNQGNTVIFVSSEISELMAVCDRILVMMDGKIVREIPHSDTLSEEVLQNAIQG